MQNLQNLPYWAFLNAEIKTQCRQALSEDLAGDEQTDISASLIEPHTMAHAKIISRDVAILCGQRWVEQIFHQLDPNLKIQWLKQDGDPLEKNQVICEIQGLARPILTGERSAMNFLQTLSATATITNTYKKALNNLNCDLLDTRKTIPGMRFGQKYAVLCGGGKNHRLTLSDRFLIKENHILACGGITQALNRARETPYNRLIEIEVETIAELRHALDGNADIIMLDNFSLAQLKEAVLIKNQRQHCAILEASGNVNLNTINAVASSGVNCISVGALTKNIQATDLSMGITMIND